MKENFYLNEDIMNANMFVYKSIEILYFNEFKRDLLITIQDQQELIHLYSEKFSEFQSSDIMKEVDWDIEKNPRDAFNLHQKDYKEAIEKLADAIAYNCRMLKRAEIEKEHVVFYRMNGTLGYQRTLPYLRKRIYDIEEWRRKLVV